MSESEDLERIEELIVKGDIDEAGANLGELEPPEVTNSEKSATQIISEDRDYLDDLARSFLKNQDTKN